MKRIALVHLGGLGDCIMATTVARQIKTDYTGCILTWIVERKCAPAILGNPYVDRILCIDRYSGESSIEMQVRIKRELANSTLLHEKQDLTFCTEIYPDNVSLFDGTIRSSIFRCYPSPITIDTTPVLRLNECEKEHVRSFAKENNLSSYKHVILFECSPSSGQSPMTLEKGISIAKSIVSERTDTAVIISTHLDFESPDSRILNGKVLSYRENAELSHYCSLFLGCFSGITWIMMTDAAKPIPMAMFIGGKSGIFASIEQDLIYFGKPANNILETDISDADSITKIALDAITDFTATRNKYNKVFRPVFWKWVTFIDYRRGIKGILGSYKTIGYYISRNGLKFSDLLDVSPLPAAIRQAFNMFIKGRILRKRHKA